MSQKDEKAENISQDKDQKTDKPQGVTRRSFLTRAAAGAGVAALAGVMPGCGSSGGTTAVTAPDTSGVWKFAVMSDTQWTSPPGDVDHNNANSSAVGIINQIQSN